MNLSRFEQFWLAEHQRLRDVNDPHLQQQQFNFSEFRQQDRQSQLLERAARLSERQQLLTSLQHWQHLRRLLSALFALIAVVLGVGVAQAMLSQTQPISLLFALNLVLMPNLVLFGFWLLFTLRRPRPSGISGAAFALLSLLQRKRGNAALEQSWLRHTQQHRLLQPLMAVTTHGFWFLIMLSSWLTLVLYLSFDDYRFQWATTILSAADVISIAELLNALPNLLFGTQVPAVIEAQGFVTSASDAGRWLTFCVLSYGVLPRGVAVLLALALYWVRLRNMKLNLQAEGNVAVLQAVINQQQVSSTVDADRGTRGEGIEFSYAQQGEGDYSVSLDFEPDTNLMTSAKYLGVVATYADKQDLLKQRAASPSASLQVRIATLLTPDRSSLRYLAQLAATTQQLTVVLVRGERDTYLPQWQQQLEQHGVNYVVA